MRVLQDPNGGPPGLILAQPPRGVLSLDVGCMSTAPATETIQNSTATPDRASPPAPRFTAGYVDGLGERVLMFDDATATSLELL